MSRRQRIVHRRDPGGAASLLPVEKQMLAVVAFYALLAPLAASHFDSLRAVPLEPLRAFGLGALLGAVTGLAVAVRQHWRL